jgi:four helix bundle protein
VFRKILHISLGSTAELETQLIIAVRLNIMETVKSQQLMEELHTISRMIQGLIKSLNIN